MNIAGGGLCEVGEWRRLLAFLKIAHVMRSIVEGMETRTAGTNVAAKSSGDVAIHEAENPNRPKDEALRWLIALQEEPDDAALAARFEVWLAQDEANARA
ncbi:FecR/PupR family sigma factor regulator [Aquamicrobium sp. NLF2-7]|uniref:FecR/PupR family sigma factor regulator n=1 Tax=Aquamicrobium sp. NLF2-7 TaxID=2918753 RepID=UPI001EFC06F4|nr:FecR/PupR family sigma factor regulator [Aquamicrobium sp. NLF2-7]MCG8273215.1 FecR/PupR family sigma factor regulator [Aquamicrobium sp. NLF2-7]